MSSSPWIHIVPDNFPSFGETGKPLRYYYNLSHYLLIAPIVLLVVTAIVYNVFVAIATLWMYKHAWRKGSFTTLNDTRADIKQQKPTENVPIVPGLPTTAWEEIFTINIKIANYLFGGVDIRDHYGYLVLVVHDYIVYMPLAMVFIQVCQTAIASVAVVLFFDYLILQVTHSCDSGVDCYDASDYNMSSLPLDCADDPLQGSSKYTCFHLSFNPVFATAIAGGFLKVAPQLIFSSITYAYLKMFKIVYFFNFNKIFKIASHVAVAIIAETFFLGSGITVLVLFLKLDSLRSVTFDQADPIHQLTILLCFVMYFLASSFVWCIIPLTKTAVRYQSCIWKQKYVAATGSRKKSPRPWIVVDRSLQTQDRKLLTDDD